MLKKDVLTLQKIKYDYKKQFFRSITIVFIMPFILIPLMLIIIYLFSSYAQNNHRFLEIVIEILLISPIAFYTFLCLSVLIDSYRQYLVIKNASFKIVTDKLIGTQEKRTYVGSAFAASFSNPYTLEFSSYGEYCILDGKNYSSSKLYSMNDKGVFNYSNIGDTFYLIIDNKGKILIAYNTKLFELNKDYEIFI